MREKRAEMRFENGERDKTKQKRTFAATSLIISLSLSPYAMRALIVLLLSLTALSLSTLPRARVRCCGVRFVSRLRSTNN